MKIQYQSHECKKKGWTTTQKRTEMLAVQKMKNSTHHKEDHDDEASLENESSEYHHVTINDINTIQEMNAAIENRSTDWQRNK
jgi:hypothetical protein